MRERHFNTKTITSAEINGILLNLIEGEKMDYNSVDSVLDVDNALQYPLELLNTLNPPGFPAHRAILKIRTPIKLPRNLSRPICATDTTRCDCSSEERS